METLRSQNLRKYHFMSIAKRHSKLKALMRLFLRLDTIKRKLIYTGMVELQLNCCPLVWSC